METMNSGSGQAQTQAPQSDSMLTMLAALLGMAGGFCSLLGSLIGAFFPIPVLFWIFVTISTLLLAGAFALLLRRNPLGALLGLGGVGLGSLLMIIATFPSGGVLRLLFCVIHCVPFLLIAGAFFFMRRELPKVTCGLGVLSCIVGLAGQAAEFVFCVLFMMGWCEGVWGICCLLISLLAMARCGLLGAAFIPLLLPRKE